MGPKKKLNLQIDCQEISEMEKSIFSEIGNDGLRFLKQDIQITSQGLTDISGNIINSLLPINKLNLLSSEVILGKGAACSVQQGFYKPLNIKVAVKTINVYDRNKRHQIMNDIKVLLRNQLEEEKNGYKCDFIVTLYGAFFDEGSVKVILELMDAGSLENIIKIYNLAKIKPEIDESILAKIALQILCGLAYLHSNNQLHRDVKPANILINSKGQVKLTDFGISKEIEQDKQFTKTSVGTRSYMSPERIKGGQYGTKGDIWGFGLTMYQLSTGDSLYKNLSQFDMIKQFQHGSHQFKLCLTNYSDDFNDFLKCSLEIDQKQRSNALQLLGHPWILKNLNSKKSLSVKNWLEDVKQNIIPLINQE